jgi:predicted O-linked N-acetylglucosamine transferase (SPINDLY family)
MRPAPVQVSHIGYCNTTGMRAVDYVVGDEITDPASSTQPYVERLLRLPNGFACWSPRPDAPEPNDLPAPANTFVTFAAFHTLPKLNERTLDLWSRVLLAVPRSRLLIWRNTLEGKVTERLLEAFVARGLPGDRIVMRADRPEGKTHLPMYHLADISLDSQPWSGHTTSCESMWMGVPFVTIRGNTHAGRMAASALTFAGASEFIAEDEDQFVSIASELAGNLGRLAELRRTLRARLAGSRLCDAVGFTRGWETALREAWGGWCRSRPD